jgi:hypothetical protein
VCVWTFCFLEPLEEPEFESAPLTKGQTNRHGGREVRGR